MQSRKRTAFLAAPILAVLAMHGTAAADEGFYLGVGAGGATLDVAISDPTLPLLGGNIDEDDTAFKVFGGFDWQLANGTLGVEGSYGNFGEPEIATSLGELQIETTGFSLFGTGAFDAGPVELFGKLGIIAWETEASLLGISGSTDDTDFAWGVGVRYNWDRFQLRGEYEAFELGSDDLEMLSLGFAFRF